MINHPNRSKYHRYLVRAYAPRGGELQSTVTEVTAADALGALASVSGRNRDFKYASLTRRWQNSPVAADRDNCHAQANGAGTVGWAVTRADLDPVAAEHRSDVETARRWVSSGKPLSALQAYGAYKSVTEEEAREAPLPHASN